MSKVGAAWQRAWADRGGEEPLCYRGMPIHHHDLLYRRDCPVAVIAPRLEGRRGDGFPSPCDIVAVIRAGCHS